MTHSGTPTAAWEEDLGAVWRALGIDPSQAPGSSEPRFGTWRVNLTTGHVFASPGFFQLYDMPSHDGPVDITAVCARIHPADLCGLMQGYENAGRERKSYDSIFRIRVDADGYGYVRAIGRYRDGPGSAGEIIGITIEIDDPLPPDRRPLTGTGATGR